MIMKRNQWHGQPTNETKRMRIQFRRQMHNIAFAKCLARSDDEYVKHSCLYLSPLHSPDLNQTGFIRQRRSRQFYCTIKTNEYTFARCRLAASHVTWFFFFFWLAGLRQHILPFSTRCSSFRSGVFHLPIFVSLVFFIISFNISFLFFFPQRTIVLFHGESVRINSFYANSFDSFISLSSLDSLDHVCVCVSRRMHVLVAAENRVST